LQNVFVFFSANAAQEKAKREKVLLLAGVSKSAAHTVQMNTCFVSFQQPILVK
jgi:hypothetical protein